MSTAIQTRRIVNGLDTVALSQLIGDVDANPRNGNVKFTVSTHWRGGTLSETRVDSWQFAGRTLKKDFSIFSDEPRELGGASAHPNPQELLMAALNACMTVGYVAGATMHGIELESLCIETEGELDLRGFLGLDPKVKPGYDEIHYIVRIKGDGTPEQFQKIHETVIATSPNRFNLSQPIKLTADLVVE
jgi:uncharacterized OsmC-like protein